MKSFAGDLIRSSLNRRRKRRRKARRLNVTEALESRVLLTHFPGHEPLELPPGVFDPPEHNPVEELPGAEEIIGSLTPTSYSLKIGTVNAQFLPSIIVDPPHIPGVARLLGKYTCCDDIPNRLERLADRIIDSGYDVIALNEMFDSDARRRLPELLRSEYPHFVELVTADELPEWTGEINLPLIPDDELPEDVEELTEEVIGRIRDLFRRALSSSSGLMLFSRYPFEEFPGGIPEQHQVTGDNLVAESGGSEWTDVAFAPFERCANDAFDCFAHKGAAMVRVRNPDSGDIYNAVFTHLNAGGSDKAQAVRTTQLDQIRELVTDTLSTEALARESVFVMGDFNINGDLVLDDDEPRESNGRREWRDQLSDRADDPFFSTTLQDAWEFETQSDVVERNERDRGLTGKTTELPADQKRIDYILKNTPGSSAEHRLCLQHMAIAHNLHDDGQILTDHFGLNADINRWADRCSPQEAAIITDRPHDFAGHMPFVISSDDGIAVVDDGVITHPGSMQWYVVPDGGTYAIAIDGEDAAHFNFEVYQSTDMSTPYQGAGGGGYRGQTRDITYTVPAGEPVCFDTPGSGTTGGGGMTCIPGAPETHTVRGRKYGVTEAPFYIRVFAVDEAGEADPLRTGEYRLVVQKHEGTSREDALILHPGLVSDDSGQRFRDIGATERFFQIDTEAPDSGRAQRLEFFLRSEDADMFLIELQDERGAPLKTAHWPTDGELDDAAADGPLQHVFMSLEEESANNSKMFLRIVPEATDGEVDYTVGWTTNLLVLHDAPRPEPGMGLYAQKKVNSGIRWHKDWDTDIEAWVHGPGVSVTVIDRMDMGTFDGTNWKEIEGFDSVRLLPDESFDLWLRVVDRRPLDHRAGVGGTIVPTEAAEDSSWYGPVTVVIPEDTFDRALGFDTGVFVDAAAAEEADPVVTEIIEDGSRPRFRNDRPTDFIGSYGIGVPMIAEMRQRGCPPVRGCGKYLFNFVAGRAWYDAGDAAGIGGATGGLTAEEHPGGAEGDPSAGEPTPGSDSMATPPEWLTRFERTIDAAPLLEWTSVKGADHHEFLLYDQSAGVLLRHDDALEANAFWPFEPLAAGATYQAFVRPVDSADQPGAWSRPLEFAVERFVPDTPEPTAPGEATDEAPPTFTWTAAADADRYDLTVYDLSTGQAALDANVYGTSYTPDDPLAPGRYGLYVRGVSAGAQFGKWSSVQFSVSATDEALPAVADLRAETTQDGRVRIAWQPDNRADRVHVHLYGKQTGRLVEETRHDVHGDYLPAIPNAGTYIAYARLEAGEAAGAWTSVEFTAQEKPADSLQAPATPEFTGPGETADPRAQFSWNADLQAETHHLLVYDAQAGVAVIDVTLAGTSYRAEGELAPGRRYIAYVQSANAAGASGWAKTSFGVLAGPQLEPPTIHAADSLAEGHEIVIGWTSSSAYDAVEVHLYNLERGSLVLRRDDVTGKSLTIAEDLSAGRYMFYVRLFQNGRASDWATYKLTVAAANVANGALQATDRVFADPDGLSI